MATLKISDLSVGDWARYDDRICQIAEIHQLSYNFGSKEICSFPQVTLCYEDDMLTYQESVPFKDIHPIPITAEILEGNGFICKDFEKLRRWECGDVAVVRDKYEDALWCVCENTDKFCFDIDVRYIHQLQHALRLAGVDKEINL